MAANNNLSINYDNTLVTQHGDFNSVDSERTKLETGVIFWQPYGKTIFSNFPDLMHAYHAIGKLDPMANIVAAPVNPQTYQEAGRTKTTINDGLDYTFPLTFKGAEVRTLAAILNIDTFAKQAGGNTTHKIAMTNTTIEDKDYGIMGNLFVWQAGSGNHLHMSYILPECGIRVLDCSGVGDDQTYNVEFYSSQPRQRVGLGTVVVAEKFFEDTTNFTLGWGPNGTNTGFQPGLGTAIGSTQTSLTAAQEATLVASVLNLQVVRRDKALNDPYRYFVDIRLNGRLVSPSELVYYDEGSGLVEFVTPPALGDVLEWTYFLKTGYPDWSNEMNYGVGEYATYNDDIWVSVNPILGTAPASTAWFKMFPKDYTQRIPYANGDISNIKNRVGNLTNPFVRWEIITSE